MLSNIESARLILKPIYHFDESDVEQLLIKDINRTNIVLDEIELNWIKNGGISDFFDLCKLGWSMKTMLTFGILLKTDKKLIGLRKLFNIDYVNKRIESGGFIDYDFEGSMFQDEAGIACQYFAFNYLKFKICLASCYMKNPISNFKIIRHGFKFKFLKGETNYYEKSVKNFKCNANIKIY